eukprot:287681-Hanusia_phi.AAC.1
MSSIQKGVGAHKTIRYHNVYQQKDELWWYYLYHQSDRRSKATGEPFPPFLLPPRKSWLTLPLLLPWLQVRARS